MKFTVNNKSGGKQHYQLNFGISLKLIRPVEAAVYQLKKFMFWLRPFHCDLCGVRQYVKQPEYTMTFESGHRLTVHNHASTTDQDGEYKSYCICRNCLADQLESGEWRPRFSHSSEQRSGKPSKYNLRFWRTKRCDVTGESVHAYKNVEIFPYIDMTFCTTAWNHGHASKQAVVRCVREGEVRTSYWGVYKKTMAMNNGVGLYIDGQGKLL